MFRLIIPAAMWPLLQCWSFKRFWFGLSAGLSLGRVAAISTIIWGMLLFPQSLVSAWALDREDVYTVDSLTIDERAENEVAAKKSGLEQIKKQAFDILFARLTMDQDWSMKPTLNLEDLENLIRDVALDDEKFGGGKYLAQATIRFRPSAIQFLMRTHNIPFTDQPGEPLLLIPVLRSGTQILLWEKGNPWSAGWRTSEDESHIVPVLIPRGDLDDTLILSADMALSDDLRGVYALLTRYKVKKAVIAVATPVVAEEKEKLRLVIDMRIVGKNGHEVRIEHKTSSFQATDGDALIKAAIGAVYRHLEEQWVQQAALRFDQEFLTTRLSIQLDGQLESWLKARAVLGKISTIQDIALVELSTNEALVDLHFIGNWDHIVAFLNGQDYDVNALGKKEDILLNHFPPANFVPQVDSRLSIHASSLPGIETRSGELSYSDTEQPALWHMQKRNQ